MLGNQYSIENIYKEEAKLFFCHGKEIREPVEEKAAPSPKKVEKPQETPE